MCGSTRSTISPSSSSTSRSTPCAAGCCGPKLMVKLRMLCSVIGANPPGLRANGEWRMANGKAASAAPLAFGFALQGSDQRAQLPAQGFASADDPFRAVPLRESDPQRQDQMRLELLQGTLRHAQKLDERSRV